MRRKEKEIETRKHIDEILQEAEIGRLGTVSGQGRAMIKPVNSLPERESLFPLRPGRRKDGSPRLRSAGLF